MNLVLKKVCKQFKITEANLKSKSRYREFADARKVYFMIMRKYSALGTESIGKTIGRPHCTVITASKAGYHLLRYDERFKENFKAVDAWAKNHFNRKKRQTIINDLDNCIVESREQTLENLIKLLL